MTLTITFFSQIDRLLAIWQETHPESWFDGKDGLVPFTFRNEVGKKEYWTSDRVRKPHVFGYTYSDVDGGQTPDSIRKRYDENYGWQSQERRGDPPTGMEPLLVFKQAQVFQYDGPTRAILIAKSKETGALNEVINDPPVEHIVQSTANQPVSLQQTILRRPVGLQKPIVEDRVLPKSDSFDLIVTNADDVNEEEVERTWYVDNVVQR